MAKGRSRKSRQTKQICTSLITSLPHFRPINYIEWKKNVILINKRRSKKQRRKKQNDNKGKITKNTIVKMSKAEKKTRQTKQIYTAHSSSPCLIFVLSFFLSLTAFIYGMWKQFEFDNIYQRSISNRKSSFFWIHVQSLSLAIFHLVF